VVQKRATIKLQSYTMNRIHYTNVVLIGIAEIARPECRLGGYYNLLIRTLASYNVTKIQKRRVCPIEIERRVCRLSGYKSLIATHANI